MKVHIDGDIIPKRTLKNRGVYFDCW